jgi:hypothetical protein
MSIFVGKKKKLLSKLRQKWDDRKTEDGAFAEFLLCELRLKADDPDVQQTKMLQKELGELERLEKLQLLRTEWSRLPEAKKPDRLRQSKHLEMSLKWHGLFVAEKEISDEELHTLTLAQLEHLRELEEFARQTKWLELFGKKQRQLAQQQVVHVPLDIGDATQWVSAKWSPSVWELFSKKSKIQAALEFIVSRPALTDSEQPDEDCPICCTAFPHEAAVLPDGECVSLPCSHIHHCFHRGCLHRWFSGGRFTCPVCLASHS